MPALKMKYKFRVEDAATMGPLSILSRYFLTEPAADKECERLKRKHPAAFVHKVEG